MSDINIYLTKKNNWLAKSIVDKHDKSFLVCTYMDRGFVISSIQEGRRDENNFIVSKNDKVFKFAKKLKADKELIIKIHRRILNFNFSFLSFLITKFVFKTLLAI